MTLNEFANRIESLGNTMDFCIEDVFSWRGSYDMPACSISARKTTRKHNLIMIDRLLNETFEGWKGGEYDYKYYQDINFEPGWSSYTDGKYLNKFLMDNGDNEDVRKIFG